MAMALRQFQREGATKSLKEEMMANVARRVKENLWPYVKFVPDIEDEMEELEPNGEIDDWLQLMIVPAKKRARFWAQFQHVIKSTIGEKRNNCQGDMRRGYLGEPEIRSLNACESTFARLRRK
jgi:hypothetical protein